MPDEAEQYFQHMIFYLDPVLPPDWRQSAEEDLTARGATPATRIDDANLIITPSWGFEGKQRAQHGAHIVTITWLAHCLGNRKLMEPRYYSPDPSKFMSGIIATATDLPPNDIEAMAAAIGAYGGQWRFAFTKDVTHLFAAAPHGTTYQTAMKYKERLGLEILVPAWFQDCLQMQQLVPTGPYSFPSPAIYKSGTNMSTLGADTEELNTRLRIANTSDSMAIFRSATLNQKPVAPQSPKRSEIWSGRKLLLCDDLALDEQTTEMVEGSIKRNGGVAVRGEDDHIEEVDAIVCRFRHGPSFFRAGERKIMIGTVGWIFACEQTGKLTQPLDQLAHFPVPRWPIRGFENLEITVTNYLDVSREYIKWLVSVSGAKFSATMSKKTTHVIAAYLGGTKAVRAQQWHIPIVNHTWLEDCFLEWKLRPLGGVGTERYTLFPPNVNHMETLGKRGFLGYRDCDPMTVLGEPPEPSTAVPSSAEPPVSQPVNRTEPSPPPAPLPTEPAPSHSNQNDIVYIDGEPEDFDVQQDTRASGWLKNAGTKTRIRSTTPRKKKKAEPAPEPPPSSKTPKRKQKAAPSDTETEEEVEMPADEDDDAALSPARSTRSKMGSAAKITTAAPLSRTVSDASPLQKKTAPKSGTSATARSPLKRARTDVMVEVLITSRSPVPSERKAPPISKSSKKPEPPAKRGKGKAKQVESEPASDDEQAATSSSKSDRAPTTAVPAGRARRTAAAKAEAQLRDVVMPDVANFQKSMKKANGDVRKSDFGFKEDRGKKRRREETEEDDSDGQRKRKANGSGIKVKSKEKSFDGGVSDDEEAVSSKRAGRDAKGKGKATQSSRADSEAPESDFGKQQTEYVIMTTNYDISDAAAKTLKTMGGKTTTDPLKCTILIANELRRTIKFICAVGRGIPIVTADWITKSVKAKKFLDHEDFALKDPKGEAKWDCNLAQSLRKAREKRLFEGCLFYITKSIAPQGSVPSFNDIKNVVMACGGNVTKEPIKERIFYKEDVKRYIISCMEDRLAWQGMPEKGHTVYHKDILLDAALRQEVGWEVETYQVQKALSESE